jgi:hypothetical protein
LPERSEFAKVLDEQGNRALELKKGRTVKRDAQKSTLWFNGI